MRRRYLLISVLSRPRNRHSSAPMTQESQAPRVARLVLPEANMISPYSHSHVLPCIDHVSKTSLLLPYVNLRPRHCASLQHFKQLTYPEKVIL